MKLQCIYTIHILQNFQGRKLFEFFVDLAELQKL